MRLFLISETLVSLLQTDVSISDFTKWFMPTADQRVKQNSDKYNKTKTAVYLQSISVSSMCAINSILSFKNKNILKISWIFLCIPSFLKMPLAVAFCCFLKKNPLTLKNGSPLLFYTHPSADSKSTTIAASTLKICARVGIKQLLRQLCNNNLEWNI